MEQKTEASQAVKFRKKPVEIEAVQWTGSNLLNIIEFTDGRKPDNRHDFAAMKWDEYAELVKRDGLKIFTLEGKMNADVGDWIIKGVKGEFYPCKPDIFELTYERAALKAQPAPTEAQAWTKQPPTVQADYWHWNGDEDAAPSIVSVLYSGSARKCFVTMNCTYSGQAEMCDKYGGWWMRIEQPGLPGKEAQDSNSIEFAGIKTAQGDDSARLDAERYKFLRHADLDELARIYWPDSEVPVGEELDDIIDRARASAETGGVKP